jgi:hypothetical protein
MTRLPERASIVSVRTQFLGIADWHGEALSRIPVAKWAAAVGVPLSEVGRCVDMISAAKTLTERVGSGIRQERQRDAEFLPGKSC